MTGCAGSGREAGSGEESFSTTSSCRAADRLRPTPDTPARPGTRTIGRDTLTRRVPPRSRLRHRVGPHGRRPVKGRRTRDADPRSAQHRPRRVTPDSFELHLQRRGLFSSDAVAYDTGRPGYPEPVYDLLRQVCGLGPGADVVEVGPGTGQATGRLLDLDATVTAVELSADFAALLATRFDGRALSVTVGPFEDVALPQAAFDLVAAATSFH